MKTNHPSVKEIIDSIVRNGSYQGTREFLIPITEEIHDSSPIEVRKLQATQALEARFRAMYQKANKPDQPYSEVYDDTTTYILQQEDARKLARFDQVIKENFGGRDE